MPKHARDASDDASEPPLKRLNITDKGHATARRVNLLDLLSGRYEPVRKRLMELLDLKATLSLLQTCRDICAAVRSHEWDINTRLKRFVRDPIGFRSVLGQYGGLISGSFALQFLERVVWPEADLDIFVQWDCGYEEMIDYLIQNESYKPTEEDDARDKYTWEVEEQPSVIFSLKTLMKGSSKIQVIASEKSPLAFILEHFYTTALFNIITWNNAYSLFPRSTFLRHETFPMKIMNDYFGDLHAKYSRRGWRIQVPTRVKNLGQLTLERGIDDLYDKTGFPEGWRSRRTEFRRALQVGGSTTWRLPLDTTIVRRPQQPDCVFEQAMFSISWTPGIEDDRAMQTVPDWDSLLRSTCYDIQTHVFSSHALQYKYLFAEYDDMLDIGRHLERLTAVQLYKLKAENRRSVVSDFYAQSMFLYHLEIEKPESW